MTIDFLIVTHNESYTLNESLTYIINHKHNDDNIILLDDYSTNGETNDIFKRNECHINLYQHAFDGNFANHKNYGLSLCKSDWIFMLDGDEIPSENLILNIRDIINTLNDCDFIYIPRLNYIRNLTSDLIFSCNFKLFKDTTQTYSECINKNSEMYYLLENNDAIIDIKPLGKYTNIVTFNPLYVNFPDYQIRLIKNIPSNKFIHKVHEIIPDEGKNVLAISKEYSIDNKVYIMHIKDVSSQIYNNIMYCLKYANSK